ncbi:MAG: cupin domain-containing protein [Chloroflexi bacterium]|nr:cupin domain-containing protein [Chloroflexota bacterium]MCI0818907.1 cupin domain-containing protein [Chloroflexota bacterium]MCI0882786.1 cupin domain-containing protein [Chloroflexota bacterium]MCI0884745.1 cupin domain-containing protein [Chloroflexota bacterium]
MTGDGAPVTLSEKLKLIADHWHPRIVARVDGYHVKLVKVKGEFVWHAHDDQDEMFLVLDGNIVIRMRDGEVSLSAGDLFVVPKGVEHCPFAEDEASLLILARDDTDHTGGVASALRAEDQEWI